MESLGYVQSELMKQIHKLDTVQAQRAFTKDDSDLYHELQTQLHKIERQIALLLTPHTRAGRRS